MSKQKIVIDCDPGHDDAVAILFAAKHMDLVGVTTVHGNNTLANTTRNGLAILELAGIDVPLAVGCAGPLVQRQIEIASVHGRTGLDGADIPAPRRVPVDIHAVDFIITMAERHQGELILAAIGPETNIALALAREPRLKRWVKEITVMGGSTTRGNLTPAAEFNIACDAEAASAVFECGIPLRIVGLNVTQQTGFDAHDIARMRASGRTVAGVLADLMAFFLARQKEATGRTVAPMHDVCAIIPYVYPDLLTYMHTSVHVELAGTYTRGMTVCDVRHPGGSGASRLRDATPPNAHVAIQAKSRELIERVLETILEYA